MSTTKTVVAKPYFNLAVEEQMAQEERDNQNPNQNTNGSDEAGQTTQNVNQTATSDGEDQSYKERWVNLKRYHDTSIHEARTKIKELEEKLSSSSASITPPKNAEELEKFKNENPEIFQAMETMLSKNAGSPVDLERFYKLEEQLTEAQQTAAIERIKSAHPDYVDVVASDDFQKWVDSQVHNIQAMVRENATDADSFIRALDFYKLDKSKNSTNSGTSTGFRVDASAADAVVTKGASAEVGEVQGRIWTREEIGKLSPREFEMFEQDIDQAFMEGRVR